MILLSTFTPPGEGASRSCDKLPIMMFAGSDGEERVCAGGFLRPCSMAILIERSTRSLQRAAWVTFFRGLAAFGAGGPSRYRSLSLNPRRARPPATTRAIQLTHIGMDQSAMMTVHSMIIRARWNSATTAKITPAARENVFASTSYHPDFFTQDSTQGGDACERFVYQPVTFTS